MTSKKRSRAGVEKACFLLAFLSLLASVVLVRLYHRFDGFGIFVVKVVGFTPESMLFGRADSGAIAILATTNVACAAFIAYFLYHWRYDDFERNLFIKEDVQWKLYAAVVSFYAMRFFIIRNIYSSVEPSPAAGYLPSDIDVVDFIFPFFNLTGLMLGMVLAGRVVSQRREERR